MANLKGCWAFSMLVCLNLAGCESITDLARRPWSSKASLEKFNFRPIESNPAIRSVDQVSYYYGVTLRCDFAFDSDPAFAKYKGIGAENLGRPVGDAAYRAIEAEVERLHPGYPGNREFAEWLFRKRMTAKAHEGYAALAASGCAATKSYLRDALLQNFELSLSFDSTGDRAIPRTEKAAQPDATGMVQ